MILAKLKESTREQHDALETVVDVMNKTFSSADYKTLLSKFYKFYSAVEPILPAAELEKEGFDISPRQKTPLLEKDLAALGILDDVRSDDRLLDFPSMASVPEAFGAIYVMEGATLGGQVITRHLREHLGLSPESGGAFFNSYGPMVGPMWKEFGAAVTAYSERNPDNDEIIVGSARATFDSFRRCFEANEATTAAVVN